MINSLQKNTFLFKEHVNLFKASNNYDVYDPQTNEIILHCREKNLNPFYKIIRHEYYYESSFIDATIRENTVVDAKVTFGINALSNVKFEIGGNNIAGREYVSIPGSGNIGSLYYGGAKIQF